MIATTMTKAIELYRYAERSAKAAANLCSSGDWREGSRMFEAATHLAERAEQIEADLLGLKIERTPEEELLRMFGAG